MTKKDLALLAIALPLIFLSLLSSDCEVEEFIPSPPITLAQQDIFITPPNYTETTTVCWSVSRHDDEPASYPITTTTTSSLYAMGTSGAATTTTT